MPILLTHLRCGNPDCRARYERPGVGNPAHGLMCGQPDLDGVFFEIGGCRIAGTDLNICPACAFKALLGRKPFRRREETITVMGEKR